MGSYSMIADQNLYIYTSEYDYNRIEKWFNNNIN